MNEISKDILNLTKVWKNLGGWISHVDSPTLGLRREVLSVELQPPRHGGKFDWKIEANPLHVTSVRDRFPSLPWSLEACPCDGFILNRGRIPVPIHRCCHLSHDVCEEIWFIKMIRSFFSKTSRCYYWGSWILTCSSIFTSTPVECNFLKIY